MQPLATERVKPKLEELGADVGTQFETNALLDSPCSSEFNFWNSAWFKLTAGLLQSFEETEAIGKCFVGEFCRLYDVNIW